MENIHAPILEKLGGGWFDSMEKIEDYILVVENQIEACADLDKRKMLRKEKEELREEKLILLRSNVDNCLGKLGGGRGDSMEKIKVCILVVENQIEACADLDERKMLRKEREQLREENLILLRSNVGNIPSLVSAGSGTTPVAHLNVAEKSKFLETTIVKQPSQIREENQYLMGGFGEGKAAGGGIPGPIWLKVDLPVVAAASGNGASSLPGEPKCLSLGFPLSNVLHDAMLKYCATSGGGGLGMLEYYDPTKTVVRSDHSLILGSSGCGKTALGLSLGSKNFLIFLEMPCGKSGGEDFVRGFQARFRDWPETFQSKDQVQAALYADIVSRLVVLKHMFTHYPDLTPIQWLLYCFSEEGSDAVRTVHSQLLAGVTYLSSALLAMIDELQVNLKELRGPKGLPLILMVDELQELGNRPAIDGKSVIETVFSAATGLPFPAVWSGTRVGVTAGKSDISGIAKVYKGHVNLRVVCDFEYLSIDSVREKLSGMLDLSSTSEGVLSRLCYLLQGRARMVATFVEVLLKREHYSGTNWPETLTDELLMDAAEKLFEGFVVERYGHELCRTCADTGYGRFQ